MAPSTRRDLVASYAGQAWTALMSIAFVPLYIRYLGVEAYGLIAFFALLQALMSQVDSVSAPVLGREMARFKAGAVAAAEARNLLRGAEFLVGGVACALAVTVWAGSSWLSTHWLQAQSLGTGTLAAAISMMGFIACARTLEALYRHALLGQGRQVLANGVMAGMATLRGVGAVAVLALLQPTVLNFFYWQGAVSVVACLLMRRFAYADLHHASAASIDWSALTAQRGFTAGMTAITILSLLLMQVDKLLLSRLLSLGDFGLYFLASAVAGALYMIAQPIAQVYFPKFSSQIARGEATELRESYHQAAQLLAVTLAPAAVLLAVESQAVLSLWTGNVALAQKAAPILSALSIGAMLNGLLYVPYQMQLAHGHTQTATRINLVAVAVVVPLIIYVAPRYGAVGAAWVWCALNAGYVLIGVNLMYRVMLRTERLGWYLNDLLYPVGAAVCVIAGISFLRADGMPPLLLAAVLLASLLAASVTAVLCASALRRPAVAWLGQVVETALRRASGRRQDPA